MKKLMFAAAIAASAAAFANPINAIGFEDSHYTLGSTFSNGGAEYNEIGEANDKYFCFTGGESNSSVVTNETVSNDKRTAYFASLTEATNTKYLALDTEGGTFWRSINAMIETAGEGEGATTTYSLGTPKTVAGTGTYLDTLVQFTVTEDEALAVGADDKLAIWLQAGEGTTNLMVRANYWASAGEDPVATNFTVTGVSIVPGTWYRLTVKAIPSITSQGAPFPAFQIFIDGTSIAAATPQYDEDFQDAASARYAAGIGDLIAANKLFPTLAERPSDLEDVTLQGVGFQGTGAVDEIVWTDDDPFPAAVVNFTLTYTAGDANVTPGAVTYTVGEGEPTPVTFTENAAQIPENASVTISKATFATGYQLAAFTVGGTPVESPSFPYSFTITSNTTVSITSELIPSEDWKENPATEITAGATAAQAYPGLASSALASADAQKLTTWAQANNIAYNDIKNDTTGTYTEAYLLNCAVADVAEEKEEFVANITIGANGTPVVTAPDGKTYNGKLQLKGKVNLSDAEWTNVESASTTYKFYMYELSL